MSAFSVKLEGISTWMGFAEIEDMCLDVANFLLKWFKNHDTFSFFSMDDSFESIIF